MPGSCRDCRKFGTKLFLKGERCLTPKCAITKRNYLPGAQGPKARAPRKSEYGLQLLEKQKAKAEYGLRERQFSKIFRVASRKKANTGEEFLRKLELRLDNVVYRLGWAKSRAHARQLVLHGKIKVNDRKTNIPSRELKLNDSLKPQKKEFIEVQKTVLPKWLEFKAKEIEGKIINLPSRIEIESPVDEQLIIEYYNR